MRLGPAVLIRNLALAFVLSVASLHGAFATGAEPDGDPQFDSAPCVAAAAADDAGKASAVCGTLIDNENTPRPDRIKALVARAGAYQRQDMIDRAIGDYDTALQLDPTRADIFHARGELWRKKGDRRRALEDFATAARLNPDHPTAKASHGSLARELERLGARMAIADKPSFNCAAARLAVEKAICADPELADLDREIDAMNQLLLRENARRGSSAGRALQPAQDQFIARRNADFGKPDYDLRQTMKDRLRQLEGR